MTQSGHSVWNLQNLDQFYYVSYIRWGHKDWFNFLFYYYCREIFNPLLALFIIISLLASTTHLFIHLLLLFGCHWSSYDNHNTLHSYLVSLFFGLYSPLSKTEEYCTNKQSQKHCKLLLLYFNHSPGNYYINNRRNVLSLVMAAQNCTTPL